MSKQNNLKKLAIYLSTKRPSRKFSMVTYGSDASGELEPREIEKVPECGTVCCAVGNGPRAGIPAGRCRNWSTYVDKFVTTDEEYNWLFDYNWFCRDNTPKGAAYRIGYFLKCGIPSWFLFPYSVESYKHEYEECLKIGKEYVDSLKRA